MASNINFSNIDENFPVAGVDNNTQGFRDNFAILKQSLAYAAAEIGELQSKSVLKTNLSDPLNSANFNVMNGTILSGTNLVNNTFAAQNWGTASSSNNVISFAVSHYHSFNINTDVEFLLTDFQGTQTNHKFSQVRVDLRRLNNVGTGEVTFKIDGEETNVNKKIWYANSDYWDPGRKLSIDSNRSLVILDIWTANGNDYFIKIVDNFVEE